MPTSDHEAAAAALGYRSYDDATDYRLSGEEDRKVADMVRAFREHRENSIAPLYVQNREMREFFARILLCKPRIVDGKIVYENDDPRTLARQALGIADEE